jgi:hypothetical protein
VHGAAKLPSPFVVPAAAVIQPDVLHVDAPLQHISPAIPYIAEVQWISHSFGLEVFLEQAQKTQQP